MVGGGFKREDGLPAITSNNIFSALGSRRRKSSKRKSDKEKDSSSLKELQTTAAVAPPQIWTPTPVEVKSWADCEEDDDDYFAMPVLPPISDLPAETGAEASREESSQGEEESEGDEDAEEADEDIEEEPEIEAIEAQSDVKVVPAAAPAPREPDRQLSRKELKKKELAELDAVLAELGLTPKDEKGPGEFLFDTKQGDGDGEVSAQSEATETTASSVSETKAPKKRKSKKEKPSKEGKDEEGAPDANGTSIKDAVADATDTAVEQPADPKEVFKKLASMKKKKSFKESDSAAKAAAAEAAARAAKLAAAKKKEKNHYNQQPVR